MKRPFAKAHEIAQRFRNGTTKTLFNKKDKTGSLYVYEVIGEDWWTGGGVTAKKVVEALDAMGDVKNLDIFINSEGGDVFEAKAIFANLKRFGAQKTVYIDGIAASAATFIAMAGDKIITAPAATWMVHEAWSVALGRAEDMRSMADVLDLENQAIAETYAKRTGRPVDEMVKLMAEETWMSAQEALDNKFTDEISSDDTTNQVDNKTSPLVAAAARTQEHIRSLSTANLLTARAEMRRRSSGLPEKK